MHTLVGDFNIVPDKTELNPAGMTTHDWLGGSNPCNEGAEQWAACADVHQLTEVLGALVPTAARSFGDLTYCSPMQQPGAVRRRRLDWFRPSRRFLRYKRR